jgi:hypothetical protein
MNGVTLRVIFEILISPAFLYFIIVSGTLSIKSTGDLPFFLGITLHSRHISTFFLAFLLFLLLFLGLLQRYLNRCKNDVKMMSKKIFRRYFSFQGFFLSGIFLEQTFPFEIISIFYYSSLSFWSLSLRTREKIHKKETRNKRYNDSLKISKITKS